jgi:hypothetical protein
MCCNLLVLVITFLLIRFILTLPTEPSASELMQIQKRKHALRRKAGLNPFKL